MPPDQCRRYELLEVLFIALAAVLCGAGSCAEMEEFGQSKEGLLRLFLVLVVQPVAAPAGARSHHACAGDQRDTSRRLSCRRSPMQRSTKAASADGTSVI